MGLLATVAQQPNDIKDYDIDFGEWFPVDDTIISATVGVAPVMPVPPSAVVSGKRVKVWIYDGGTSGLTYKVTLLAITNDGRQKEVEIAVKVREE